MGMEVGKGMELAEMVEPLAHMAVKLIEDAT